MFMKSLESGTLPQNWKSAQVTPIFKEGNWHSRNNYRPISLTSPVVRLFESIIKDERFMTIWILIIFYVQVNMALYMVDHVSLKY